MTNSTLNLRKPSPAANDNDTSESNDKRCRKAPKCYAPPLNSLRQARYQLPENPGRRALAQPKMLKATLNASTIRIDAFDGEMFNSPENFGSATVQIVDWFNQFIDKLPKNETKL